MPLLRLRRGEADRESLAAAAKSDSSTGFEAKIAPARQQPNDLLALAPRERRSSWPRERERALQKRLAAQFVGRLRQQRCARDHDVPPEGDRGTKVNVERSIELLSSHGELLDAIRESVELLILQYELSPQSVPREPEIAVRLIPAPGKTALCQELEDLAPGDSEQRPDHPVGPSFSRAGEAREAAPTALRKKVCLDPIVSLVCGCDPRGPGLARHLEERLVADPSRRGFRRKAELPAFSARVPAPLKEGEPEPSSVLRDEPEVPIRVPAAPAVVDVRDGKRPAELRRELRRREEKGRRIRTPRNGEEDRRAAGHQALLGGAEQSVADRIHS
jgi:hypothetical protein